MTDLAIRVEGLTKRFDTVTALDGIDLEIPSRTYRAGSDHALRGRSDATVPQPRPSSG
jgi:hypothetical protein